MHEEAAAAATTAYREALRSMSPIQRRASAGLGADGTMTYVLDEVVEAPVLDVLARHQVNVLSEEIGWIDRASAVTIVLDPIDGTANAAAGVPLACFSGALVVDDEVREALVVWFDGNRRWSEVRGSQSTRRVSECTTLDTASVSLLRPRAATRGAASPTGHPAYACSVRRCWKRASWPTLRSMRSVTPAATCTGSWTSPPPN